MVYTSAAVLVCAVCIRLVEDVGNRLQPHRNGSKNLVDTSSATPAPQQQNPLDQYLIHHQESRSSGQI